MRTHLAKAARLLVLALALLPLRGDGGQAESSNVNTSLLWSVAGPVAGDEAFFKLPSGPANLMILLDVSGSMNHLPQCGDFDWDDTNALATCKSPVIADPVKPIAKGQTYSVTGTCTPWTASASLEWMNKDTHPSMTPTTALPDPGRTNALLHDTPPWGTGCTGDACLFDPNGTYNYGGCAAGATTCGWWATNAGSGARRRPSDDATGRTQGCVALNADGSAMRDISGNLVDLGASCQTCMSSRGFYFYKVWKTSSFSNTGYPNAWSSVTPVRPIFKGTFLNANPPKFVAARKVLKDVAWMDPASPTTADQVRLGLAILDTTTGGNQRAKLVVPLGPSKDSSYPATQQNFAQSRQYVLSILNYDTTAYADATGATMVSSSTIGGGFFDPNQTSTPLASALFNVGQYFTSSGIYTKAFGSTYELASWVETSSGSARAPWVTSRSNQCSICWACQKNAVMVLTDGSPNSEITLPTALVSSNGLTGYDNTTYMSSANCGTNGTKCVSPSAGTSVPSPLPRIASWLRNSDLRDNAKLAGQQALTVHTIGFGVFDASAPDQRPAAILKATANMGGGIFQSAANFNELGLAVGNVVNLLSPKENAFSAASANSLQTVQTASSEAYMTRFRPNESVTWEGHVFQGLLFDEFLNGCDPTKTAAAQPTVQCGGKTVSANFHGTDDPVTGLSRCDGVYLIDSDCDEIAEDATTGDFVKKGQATPANFPWDGGAVLSDATKAGYRSADESAANKRNVFTWVNGARVDLTTANAATLRSFMNVDATWCSALLSRIGVSGGTDPTLECTKQIIHFVRGWDVLDEDGDGCGGPNNASKNPSSNTGHVPLDCSKGEQRDRANDDTPAGSQKVFWKLGDVFHSSPAIVQAPVDEVRCDTAYEKQCAATIHSPSYLPDQTPWSPSGVDQYAVYRSSQVATRQRVLLVGANDGMLHAFDAGSPDTSKKPDLWGSYPYTSGTGAELWAFVPPDLLPKLRLMLDAHQYMVDGSVMVRDVWFDANGDHAKSASEFHTVAIFGRRSGGDAYTALDVSNPSDYTKVKLLWNFPDGASDDAHYMAQSWSDFAPRPPPILPVRLASSGDPRGWEERWIVMINGGYDPALALGRAVFMLDAWTGSTLWRFTDDDFKSLYGYGKGTSMFPVPGGVALVDVGAMGGATIDADGFADTATWGDLGGNVWVARFHEPGKVVNGKVTNWFAARAFEQQRRSDDQQYAAGRNEFFYLPATAYDPTTRTLRAYLGTGNREQILTKTATCGTDNLMACCQNGCTAVTGTVTEKYGTCDWTSSFSCTSGKMERAATSSATACSSLPTGGQALSANATIHWECPGAGTVADATGSYSCDANGTCATISPVASRDIAGTYTTPSRNRFFGIWAYGRDPRKAFNDQATAKAFDQNRFTDVAYTGCTGPRGGTCKLVETTYAKVTASAANGAVVTTTCSKGTVCSATGDDPGWFYEYGDVCPAKSCADTSWTDEKTGSGATIVYGCATWGGLRPPGAQTSTDPCKGEFGTPATYGYVGHFLSGVPTASCGYADSGTIYRATKRTTTAPPTGATVRVTLRQDGQQRLGAINLGDAAQPTSQTMATRQHIAEPVYWLEVPRQAHDCRHDAVKTTTACN